MKLILPLVIWCISAQCFSASVYDCQGLMATYAKNPTSMTLQVLAEARTCVTARPSAGDDKSKATIALDADKGLVLCQDLATKFAAGPDSLSSVHRRLLLECIDETITQATSSKRPGSRAY